jgi:hypothetical protein
MFAQSSWEDELRSSMHLAAGSDRFIDQWNW